MLKQKVVPVITILALALLPFMLPASPISALAQSSAKASEVPIKGVWVRLAKSSGGHEITHVAQQQSGRVTSTDATGNFSFANVEPGEYVLTFSALEPIGDLGTQVGSSRKLDNTVNQMNQMRLAKAIQAGDARITITGVVGGPIETIWPVKVKQASDNTQRVGQFDPLTLDMSTDKTDGPGKPKYKNIVLRVDATSGRALKGIVSLVK